jgi:hypothetical protein
MKFKGFNSKEFTLSSKDYIVYDDSDKSVSNLHRRVRTFLKNIFPKHLILEEVTLPGSKVSGVCNSLRLDFLLPQLDLAIEVHGEQHYKYNSHFFKTKNDFFLAIKRDKFKVEWCEINNLNLAELKFNESEDEWRERIRKSIHNEEDR